MSIEVPSSVQWLIPIVVGARWPDGDEDQLRGCADAWRTFGGQAEQVVAEAQAAMTACLATMDGQAADAFAAYVQRLLSGSEQSLEQLVPAADQLGEALDNAALEVEYAKMAIKTAEHSRITSGAAAGR